MIKLRSLGPGILLAATSVGASHILMSPEAGARYELQLVWLVLAVHVLKYPAFEFAPRYVAARRESLLEAYARAPGPKHWALWMGLLDMTLQAAGVLAALLGLTASFLVAAVGLLSLGGWSLVLALGLLALLRWGRYASLRALNLLLMLLFALGTAVAFFAAPPAASELPGMLRPRLPEGSILLVAAILGFMPTSVAVSVWQSLWALEQGRFRPGTPDAPAERRSRLREGLADLRLGYGLSALLAAAFVCLGATLLYPRGLVPEGPEVATTLSQIYTSVLGPWMGPVFLTTAFFALLTTCYTSMDGFPRTFVAVLQVLRGEPAVSAGGVSGASPRAYWIFLLAVTFGGMAILAAVPDPAAVVKVVGALGLLLSPFYFGLNLWAVTRLIEDPE
ncbi:MAG: divalent metal cation transporter, partial [Acidobacteriota bacterium]|nr:divalent metal cation transporter [Acidobacteriota bacterium]